MRVLDKYIIKSFIAPYIISFTIAEFVLLMQFMWKYIDEFAGRGLSMFDFFELMFYNSVAIIPMAVPITILIASVMVYGNLAERYELSSMKSAGISLFRIMRPGFVVAVMTFLFSVSVSNYFKPKSQVKFLKIFTAIRKKKPTLNIKEKVFNKDFSGFVIQTDKKDKNGRDIEKVKIYNLSNRGSEKYNIISAERGEIFTTEDSRYFVMKLYNGTQYVEQRKTTYGKKSGYYPLIRTKFDTLEKAFDMSEFNNLSSGIFYEKRTDVLNSFQLLQEIIKNKEKEDEKAKNVVVGFSNLFSAEIATNDDKNDNNINDNNSNNNDDNNVKSTTKKNLLKIDKKKIKENKKNKVKVDRKDKFKTVFNQSDTLKLKDANLFVNTFESKRREEILRNTHDNIRFHKNKMTSNINSIERLKKYRDYWILGLNQQYSWAFICIIFLFVGAPIGSIIRKGGYGYPVLVTILFFMAFILLSISGIKFNRSGLFNPYFNAWLPVIFIFPISIFLTIKAIADTKFNINTKWMKKIGKLFKKKKQDEEEHQYSQ